MKEGRVLSSKNRELIGKCVTMLKELMDATEPEPKDNSQGTSEKIVELGIIMKDKINDEPKAESLADVIQAAIKEVDVKGLVRGELKRLKGEV